MCLPAILFALALLFGGSAAAEGDKSCPDKVCVTSARMGPTAKSIDAENLGVGPVTLTLKLTRLHNAKALKSGPQTLVLKPKRHLRINEIYARDSRDKWTFAYSFFWRYGARNASHDDSQTYLLPYEDGSKYPMIQGPGGKYSHVGERAYDFSMPEGTRVYAARAGKVIAVRDNSKIGGPSRKFENDANYVYILHTDGTVGRYLHLKFGGALAKLGDEVKAGEPIGLSGSTGFASRPHLHFEVCTPIDGERSKTFNLWFATKRAGRTYLAEGGRYTAKH